MYVKPKPASWDGPHDGEQNQCNHGREFMGACPAEKHIAKLETEIARLRAVLLDSASMKPKATGKSKRRTK